MFLSLAEHSFTTVYYIWSLVICGTTTETVREGLSLKYPHKGLFVSLHADFQKEERRRLCPMGVAERSKTTN